MRHTPIVPIEMRLTAQDVELLRQLQIERPAEVVDSERDFLRLQVNQLQALWTDQIHRTNYWYRNFKLCFGALLAAIALLVVVFVIPGLAGLWFGAN